MKLPCDCCEGPDVLTPLAIANRPGLSQIDYRVGKHGTFLETMQARLSNPPWMQSDDKALRTLLQTALAGLRSRERGDASLALLDAWATVAEVLTFYQERIANEAYLRTATERRSVLELARLIGYVLRPGVSASVYLAYQIEKDAAPVTIPAGARVNSIPAPGEQMQAFETAEPLEARVEWNQLKPRLTRPQTASSIMQNGLYLKGTASNLKVNDPVLVKLDDGKGLKLDRIGKVEVDNINNRTLVILRGMGATQGTVVADKVNAMVAKFTDVDQFDVSPSAAMTQRVLATLSEVTLIVAATPQKLVIHLEETALPNLMKELHAAKEGRFTKLEPWVEGLIGELNAVHRILTDMTRAAAVTVSADSTTKKNQVILGDIIEALKLMPSVPPATAKQLPRDILAAYGQTADTLPRLLTALQPVLKSIFYKAWQNLPPPTNSQFEVYALRVAAAPFGHNAPLLVTVRPNSQPTFDEWKINKPWNQEQTSVSPVISAVALTVATTPDFHKPTELYLDNDYDIAPDSRIVIEKSDGKTIVSTAANSLVRRSLAAYGLSGKTVQVNLDKGDEWIDPNSDSFAPVRTTRIFAGSEKLDLAEEPVTDDIEAMEIELGELYSDLEPGRWLIITGERSDIEVANKRSVPGIKAAELVMIAAVAQKIKQIDQVQPNSSAVTLVDLPDDKIHTFITLAKPLAYKYKRDTVTIYGNVVKATNGETRSEVLGGGDAAKALQQFILKQPPLTYVSAATVSGIQSTLEVRVNDVLWHETENIAALGPNDRRFVTQHDDDAKTSITFGNGQRGARLPTGQENIKASYRNGIGKPGNVKAEQISLLATRPLGVKGVINPIRASGGANKESRDQARKNAPLAVMALDRLVSTQDYADFARTFGGVGKASARRLSDGQRQLVHVTIAGVEDIPIEPTSDLYRNLRDALHRYGDLYLPILLSVRERLVLVVSAKVRINADYQWESVEPKIRAAVLATFSFENLELAEDLFLSNAMTAIQAIPGVIYVDVDVFDTLTEAQLLAGFAGATASKKTLGLKHRIKVEPARVEQSQIKVAQFAYLTPDVPDTLILQELKA